MVLLRHGDENPPTPPKNATTVIHSSHWKELSDDPAAYFPFLRFMNAKEIEDGTYKTDKLQPSYFFHPTRRGSLTKRGFMQHVKLGQFLASRYDKFLGLINSVDQIYVRSAKSSRAMQV